MCNNLAKLIFLAIVLTAAFGSPCPRAQFQSKDDQRKCWMDHLINITKVVRDGDFPSFSFLVNDKIDKIACYYDISISERFLLAQLGRGSDDKESNIIECDTLYPNLWDNKLNGVWDPVFNLLFPKLNTAWDARKHTFYTTLIACPYDSAKILQRIAVDLVYGTNEADLYKETGFKYDGNCKILEKDEGCDPHYYSNLFVINQDETDAMFRSWHEEYILQKLA